METDSSSIDDEISTQRISTVKKDAIAEKEKLLRDIQELKCVIKQYEFQVNTLCFKDIEEHITKLQIPTTQLNFGKIPNVETDLQNEMYNLAGFNCVKYRRNELVFNFTIINELQENNTYAVQIFIKNGKGFLGKWVMPMSINMNDILTKTPIDKIKNINVFLKNCQRHINCYVQRQEQYLKFKKHILHMKYCNLHSSIGYTQINLELYGVVDVEKDECLNLIIYIMYHSDEARPFKIDVDTINQDKLSDDRKRRLKVYWNTFKTLDLTTAFDQMLADDSGFIWMRIDDSDNSPLELNDISSSEEGFLTELLSSRKRSLRKTKQRNELQKKWKKIKRQKGTSSFTTTKNITSSEDNRSKTEVSYIQKPNSTRKKKVAKVALVSNLEETTPLKQPKDRLRQMKLNFQAIQDASSDSANKNLAKSKLHNKSDKSRIAKLVSSTPLAHANINTLSSSSDSNVRSSSLSLSISDIEKQEENTNKLKMTLRTVSPLKKRRSVRLLHSRNKI